MHVQFEQCLHTVHTQICLFVLVLHCGYVVVFVIIICPIAIAYSMGQIIKPVCLCPCVRLRALSRSHFLMDFHQNWHRHKQPKSKNEFVGGKHRTTPSPFCPKPPSLGEKVLKIHANINNNPITASYVC